MRNLVEIHGLEPTEAVRVRKRIFKKLRIMPFVKDLEVEIFPTDIENRERGSKPFLRLVNGCQDGTPLIIKQLLEMDMDVDHIKLNGFYPKRK